MSIYRSEYEIIGMGNSCAILFQYCFATTLQCQGVDTNALLQMILSSLQQMLFVLS